MNCCFCFSEYPGEVGFNFGFDVFPTFTNLLQSSVFRFHFPLLPDFPNIPSHNPPNAFMIILFVHPRMPEVAASDYVITWQRYPWQISFAKLIFQAQSMKSLTRSVVGIRSCDIMLGDDFSHTLLV